MSGPALKPVALKCVYDAFKACPAVPIIGTGGVTTGLDALEMIMAGATTVGVGSAIYYRGADALEAILREMDAWVQAHGVTDVAALIGFAHREPVYATFPTGAPIPAA
jgi:dihydroorotate dehydrogenase (NAD+) catalytic subunit